MSTPFVYKVAPVEVRAWIEGSDVHAELRHGGTVQVNDSAEGDSDISEREQCLALALSMTVNYMAHGG